MENKYTLPELVIIFILKLRAKWYQDYISYKQPGVVSWYYLNIIWEIRFGTIEGLKREFSLLKLHAYSV